MVEKNLTPDFREHGSIVEIQPRNGDNIFTITRRAQLISVLQDKEVFFELNGISDSVSPHASRHIINPANSRRMIDHLAIELEVGNLSEIQRNLLEQMRRDEIDFVLKKYSPTILGRVFQDIIPLPNGN